MAGPDFVADPASKVRYVTSLIRLSASLLRLALVVVVIIAWIAVRLFVDSGLTRQRYGASFVTGSTWDVPHQSYGALPVIFGTIVSSALALVIAVPLSVGAALFLTESRPTQDRQSPHRLVIELLAAIPSVILRSLGLSGSLPVPAEPLKSVA